MVRKKKISIIGAGNVGRETAGWCAVKELGDIILWNRSKEKAIGNALDLMEAAPLVPFNTNIIGTDKLKDTARSDIIIFTAGSPRKPGMNREELVRGNASVIKPLVKKLAKLSPRAILIMVTNPLDAMTYAAFKASGFPKHRVIGMAGILDSSRLESFIAKRLKVDVQKVNALVLGTHGESMVPLPRFSRVGNKKLSSLLSDREIEKLVNHTKKAGAEIVELLKANASFSVGAAAAKLVEAIVKNKKEILPCSVYLEGEYGHKDIFVGVPCKIGSQGLEKIVELKLNEKEQELLDGAVESIRDMIKEM